MEKGCICALCLLNCSIILNERHYGSIYDLIDAVTVSITNRKKHRREMKLGTETGSVVNHLMSRGGSNVPVVGKGATELMWTDRKAYFVNSVSEDLKECVIERAKPIRTDKNGMSEAQSYKFERTGQTIELKFRWNAWRHFYICPWTNKKKNQKMNISFGHMSEYYDFSF